MVLRSYPLMVHHWENGIKQAIARKCRDTRRALNAWDEGEDTDHDSEPEQERNKQGVRARRIARQFIDDEAIVVRDTDDELPDLRTPPAQLTPTPTQTQGDPIYYL